METFNFYCSLSITSSEWSFIYFHLCFFLLSLGCLLVFFLMVSLWACWLLISVCIIVRAVVNWLWFVGSSHEKLCWWATCFLLLGFGCAWTNLLDLGRTRTKLLLLLKNLGASQKILTTTVNFLLEGMWSLTGNIGPMFKMIWDVNCLYLPWAWFSVHCHCAELKKKKKEKKYPTNPKSSSQEQRSSALGLCVCSGAVCALCWQEPVPALTVC